MEILQQFMAYAADFEKTLLDDDWSRLARYFTDDAVYEIEGSSLACRLQGRDAIFAGLKKSLDGFDRKFPGRDIAVLDGPHVSDDEIRMRWQVTYTKDGVPPFVLSGRGLVRYRGDRIAYLSDSYDADVDAHFADWQRTAGMQLAPGYV
jgi:hypothetical protein